MFIIIFIFKDQNAFFINYMNRRFAAKSSNLIAALSPYVGNIFSETIVYRTTVQTIKLSTKWVIKMRTPFFRSNLSKS